MAEQEQPRTVLRFWQHGAIFLLACAVIVSRRPDAVFHAQFYAEDGHVWYADAYNLGWWPALFRTWTGYFLTLPRLGASLALLVPLYRVPLLLNLIAVAFQALPVNLLLTSRSSHWGSLRRRALLAGMYLALPNCDEITRSITAAHWLIALSAFLLLVAPIPRGIAGRIFDIFIMALCGLSGPFCIFLLPISVFLAWKYRERWRYLQAGIFAASCLVQSWALMFLAPAARTHRAMGASPELFARILGSQVYLGALFGTNWLSELPGRWPSILLSCIAVGGTAFVAICYLRSSLAMKLFLLFSVAVFAGGLIAPVEWGRPTVPVWEVYAGVPGLRYWFFPTLAFAWSILLCLQNRTGVLKAVSAVLLCMMCFGVIRDWRHPAFPETHFAESVKRFEAAPEGTTVTIQEHPEGWNMRLNKHL
jgi:hypothetical protein